jgi:hypothetical protein
MKTFANFLPRVSLVLLIGLGLTPGHSFAQDPQNTQAQDAKRTYKSLVERVKGGDKAVNFVELLSAASDWDLAETSNNDAPDRDKMVSAFKNKDYKRAVELAEVVLDYEFTNRGLHKATENAYRQLGAGLKADFHRDVANQILNALLTTGDGKTVESAYCVQSINEEYLIMNHFGYQVVSQAYLMSGESSYDVLSGNEGKSKKPVSLYFDISGHFKRCVQGHRKE